jgi:hypothetical protein
MSEPMIGITLDEAKSIWKMLSHDAHGLSDDALRVRDVMRRIQWFIDAQEELHADPAAGASVTGSD